MSSTHSTAPAMLLISSGPYSGRRARLTTPVCAIGTDERCHLRPPNPTVAPVHATIHYHQGAYYIKDQKSATGTYVNDRRVDMVKLRHGDTLRMGDLIFTFEHATSARITAPRPSSPIDSAPAARMVPAPPPIHRAPINWTARLYSLTLLAIVILGVIGAIATVGEMTAPPPPPPEFDAATAAPATLLYFYADW